MASHLSADNLPKLGTHCWLIKSQCCDRYCGQRRFFCLGIISSGSRGVVPRVTAELVWPEIELMGVSWHYSPG